MQDLAEVITSTLFKEYDTTITLTCKRSCDKGNEVGWGGGGRLTQGTASSHNSIPDQGKLRFVTLYTRSAHIV